MKTLLLFIFLGLLQGFTEPLPISSSGHLVLAQHFLDVDLPGLTFEIMVNFGSLIAILVFYRKFILQLISNSIMFIKTKEKKYRADFIYVLLLIIATIPATLFGYLLKDFIGDNLATVIVVAIMLLVTATVLLVVNQLKNCSKEGNEISILDAILIGFAQVFALIPGISRSGATVSMGLFRKLSVDTALKFSFLMFIPVSLGSMILGVSDVMDDSEFSSNLHYYIIAIISSAVATYFALQLFRDMLKHKKLYLFSIYCALISVTVLVIYIIQS